MRILYLTRYFNRSGYYILERLINDHFNVVGVVVKKGVSPWNNRMMRSFLLLFYKFKCYFYRCEPSKFLYSEELLAKKNKLNLIKTNDINSENFFEVLKKLKPHIIVIGGGWHQLLAKKVYSFPPKGSINVHPSLLPSFRGTSVHRWQIMKGVAMSGVTIHFIDDSFDTGDIIAQESVRISTDDTPQDLFEKAAKIAATLMSSVLKNFQVSENGGNISHLRQKDTKADYFHKWSWDDDALKINWNGSFLDIYNFVRATHQESYQYKGPIFVLKGEKYFLRKAFVIPAEIKDKPDWLRLNAIYITRSDSKGIYLDRYGESYTLIISQLQKYDRYYKFRRAFNGSQLVKKNLLSIGQIFNAC